MKIGVNEINEVMVSKAVKEIKDICVGLEVREISTVEDETSYDYGDIYVLVSSTDKEDRDLTFWLMSELSQRDAIDAVHVIQTLDKYSQAVAVSGATVWEDGLC